MRDKYTFKEITYNETKNIILNYHYAQRMPSISYAFGCYEGEKQEEILIKIENKNLL